MAWDLATARIVTSATGTTSDAALTLVMDTVVGTLEDLLGRALLYKRDDATFYYVDKPLLRLIRYPIERVISINGKTSLTGIKVHHRDGWISLEQWAYGGKDVVVDYIGGYKQLPVALERAMWEAFQTLWSTSDPTTGAPVAGSGGSTVQTGGEINRITLADFGSVSFDTKSASSGGGATLGAMQQDLWGWLSPWASIFQIYRREAALSFPFAYRG